MRMHHLPSVSFHTMPSNETVVPGSSGPKQSGSVMVAISVPVPTSTWNGEKNSFQNYEWKCVDTTIGGMAAVVL